MNASERETAKQYHVVFDRFGARIMQNGKLVVHFSDSQTLQRIYQIEQEENITQREAVLCFFLREY